MRVKELFTDDKAVSPVIGVILLVAMTVILAAVVGAFVLSFSNSQTKTPQIGFDISSTADSPNNTSVTITHAGGDALDVSAISVNINGTEAYDGDDEDPWQVGFVNDGSDSVYSSAGEATAGSDLVIKENATDEFGDGDQIEVIWSNPNSDDTAIIAEGEI